MYIYTTYDIGQTVYGLDSETAVIRYKVEGLRVTEPNGKREIEYYVRDFCGTPNALMEEELFWSPDAAFHSLEPPAEAKVEYPPLDEPMVEAA